MACPTDDFSAREGLRVSRKKLFGIWAAISVLLAGGFGLGGMAFRSHLTTTAIREELAAAEAHAPRRNFAEEFQFGHVPDAGRADRERLRSELWTASTEAENWVIALSVYLTLLIGGGFLLLAGIGARKLFRALRKHLRPTVLAPKLSSAAHAFTNSMPRQPTVGGGRQSTADELRKWASLRDDGLISQEEFAQMREKLLGPGANA